MTGSNNIDIRTTFDAWFDVLVKILQKKIAILGIGDYKFDRKVAQHLTLFDSIDWKHTTQTVDSVAGELNYNYYGKMVDMGVGGNYYKGNPGDVPKVNVQRKRKEWQSKILYSQVMRLSEIYKQKYGEGTAKQMVAMIHAVNDLKAGAYKK